MDTEEKALLANLVQAMSQAQSQNKDKNDDDKKWHETTGGKVAIGAGGAALGIAGTMLVQKLTEDTASELAGALLGGSPLDLLGG